MVGCPHGSQRLVRQLAQGQQDLVGALVLPYAGLKAVEGKGGPGFRVHFLRLSPLGEQGGRAHLLGGHGAARGLLHGKLTHAHALHQQAVLSGDGKQPGGHPVLQGGVLQGAGQPDAQRILELGGVHRVPAVPLAVVHPVVAPLQIGLVGLQGHQHPVHAVCPGPAGVDAPIGQGGGIGLFLEGRGFLPLGEAPRAAPHLG